MYNPKSTKAEEFISHEEILATLKYADENKNNVALIDEILKKARQEKGLTHREVLVLLDCEIPEKNEEIEPIDDSSKEIQEEKPQENFVVADDRHIVEKFFCAPSGSSRL